jgi:tetratricopeptide (TPR) repeat protein
MTAAGGVMPFVAESGPQYPAPALITIDYPLEGSVFPPEITAPTFLWYDPAENATVWLIEAASGDGSPGIRVIAQGERPRIGEIDARAIGETNELPKLTPREAASRSWKPDDRTWEAIKRHSIEHPLTLMVTGYAGAPDSQPVSRGKVTIQTAREPIGAPIFYRDVPLMPSEVEKGVIKPLGRVAIPLIGWRLRDVSEPRSRLLMEGLYTCANCHSFSRDGKTLGMDIDGPREEKRTYAIATVAPRMTIRNKDVIRWYSLPGKPGAQKTIAFMAQLSPDGQSAVATVNEAMYVENFRDYRFLQVFYPTRGLLAWYNRTTGRMQALPGADDPRYVHTNAVWTPDGKHLIFARAEAKDPYPPGSTPARYANDPNETPIRYDLYRIPFNGGLGGRAEPIAGASRNGMSNSFPKVSPDGRWIVFVQSRNGQLMRPDSQLYIVPLEGGQARRMRCNTPLMNSWHSFSPNGRWLVFSSKSRSPYTQMFLTHLDEDGRDSPAILIEDSTAANRAVNIPEFLNIPPGGLLQIDVPASEFYRLYDSAWQLGEKGETEAAISEWNKALALSPEDAEAHTNLAAVLIRKGALAEATAHLLKALETNPKSSEAHNNLGIILVRNGSVDEGIAHFRKALEEDPDSAQTYNNLGRALALMGRPDEAIAHHRRAVELNPQSAEAHEDLGTGLLAKGKVEEAIVHLRKALELNPKSAEGHCSLGHALAQQGRPDEAIAEYRRALEDDPRSAEAHHSLGIAFARKGNLDEAITHWRLALELEPKLAQVHYNLAGALVQQGKREEAIRHYQEALQARPDYAQARFRLGDTYFLEGRIAAAVAEWREGLRLQPNETPVLDRAARALATSPDASVRNGAEAVELAERAMRLSGGREPGILDTLAAAYAEAGRFPEAVRTARRALALATQQNKQALTEALKARIALYETASPLREKAPLR